MWTGEPAPELVQDPDAPHYPGGRYPAGDPAWNRLDVPPTGTVVHATSATATFNGEDAAYRTAFHLSHFGGMPADAGDFNGDGIDDLLVTEHFGWVDGMQYAGEVDLYYGRRAGIDPRREVPDVVFYGDEAGAKLGLSVAGVGDVNGDGWDDIAMSAGFHSERDEAGHTLPNAGEIYLVFGGYLQAFGCTVKVRTTDIGVRVPGIVFAGGHDGRRYVGWANDLDAGDFNGDGVQDLLIGAADPYPGDSPTFAARGYLVYGGHGLPLRYRGYRLGVDRDVGGIRSAVYEAPDGEVTRASLGFQATFVGDVNGDGRDDIAFATGRGGSGDGAVALFLGEPGPPPGAVVPLADAQTTIVADSSAALRFRRLEGARPAGDVDGDGHQDVLLQARATQQYVNGTWTRVGASVLLRGADALPHSVGLSQLGPVFVGRPGDAIGQPAVDMPADIDGDGFSDLLLNDPYFHEPVGGEQQMRGRLWLVRGGPHLPDVVDVEAQAARTFVADTRVPGMFGFTWTTGDWNGDGRPDIVIGDHYAGDHALHVHAGRAYVLTNGVSFSW